MKVYYYTLVLQIHLPDGIPGGLCSGRVVGGGSELLLAALQLSRVLLVAPAMVRAGG